MKETRRREFPLFYAKGKKLFNVVVHISDAPGSMGKVLDALGARVNLIGTSSYSLGDGSAMFAAFAEALDRRETPATLKGAIDRLEVTIEADVSEGKDGLLVDTFHTGIQVGGDGYMLMSREGLSEVFDRIVRLFGTGGEVLLYEEGKALGRDSSERLVEVLGRDAVVGRVDYLARVLTPEGWGVVSSKTTPEAKESRIAIDDCFECSGKGVVRKKCDFLRGFFEGAAEAAAGATPRVEESGCKLHGEKACTFRVIF